MRLFLADIEVSGIAPDKMDELRKKEEVVMKQYASAGKLQLAHVRKDLSGAYLYFLAKDDSEAHQLL